jgi:fluoroquinolone resistance protein
MMVLSTCAKKSTLYFLTPTYQRIHYFFLDLCVFCAFATECKNDYLIHQYIFNLREILENQIEMSEIKIEDRVFENISKEYPFLEADYEYCQFINCDFSSRDLSAFNFLECRFEYCDLSNAKLYDTGFKTVQFKDCKMMGLRFEDGNPFLLAMTFENCNLSFSSFYQLKLKDVPFLNCMMEQVDFIETNLTGAVFANCNLKRTNFEYAILKNANFQTAKHFNIDPETNQIAGAKFSAQGALALLDKYKIVIV